MELLLSPSILGVTAVAFKGFSSSLTGLALKTGWIDAYGSNSPSTVGDPRKTASVELFAIGWGLLLFKLLNNLNLQPFTLLWKA